MNPQRQLLLGIFFVVALSILTAWTLFGTDTSSLFGKQLLIDVYFPEAHGLREGDPVLAAGMRVGRVKTLESNFEEDYERRIHATLTLDERIVLKEDCWIEIRESTLLGGREVNIEPGSAGGNARDLGESLLGHVQPNPLEGIAGLGDFIEEIRAPLGTVFNDLSEIVSTVKSGEGTVGRLLMDDGMGAELADAISNIRGVSASLQTTEGLLGTLINDPSLKDRALAVLTDVEGVTTSLRETEGLLGKLINDPELANEVDTMVASFSSVGQKLDSGDGLLGQLMTDEELVTEFRATIANLRTTSDDLQAVLTTVRAGDGSMGKLLMDQELYDEALTAVKLLTRSLEDYREAAPVSAFTSVLFSAF